MIKRLPQQNSDQNFSLGKPQLLGNGASLSLPAYICYVYPFHLLACIKNRTTRQRNIFSSDNQQVFGVQHERDASLSAV